MEDKERRGADLDEILREFDNKPPKPNASDYLEQTRRMDPAVLHAPKPDLSEKTQRIAPEDIQPAQPKSREWAEETRRMDTITFDTGKSDETIRFDVLRSEIAGLIHGENAPDVEKVWTPKDAPRTEAFTERWEPEYEQPIGTYTPPQPIQFQPRSQLIELKRKLVAGPEKKFYELTEVGVGKLQAAIFLSLLVALISAASTIMYAKGMVQDNRTRLMIFSQFFFLLVSGLLGSYQMLEGITNIGKKRFTPNTLLAVTFIVCCLDGIMCLRQVRVPCCAAFSLEVTMSLWGTYQRRSTQLSQLDTMRKAGCLNGVAACPTEQKDKQVIRRTEGQVEDFMDNYEAPSVPEKILNLYTLCAMGVALVIGILASVLKTPQAGLPTGISAGLQVSAVCLLAALPASIFINQSRPAWILQRRLHKLGTVLCGRKAIDGLQSKTVFPITGSDLYTPEDLRMNGMKFFGNRDPEQVISYATALVNEAECGFQGLFNNLLDSHNGRHYEAYDICYYDNGGMSGVVQGEPVLLGSWVFMKEQNVEAPDSARVSYGMYIAIKGELCGVFAVNYGKNQSAAAGLRTLTAYKNVECTLVSDDFVVTHGFLRAKFAVKPNRVNLPDYEDRVALRQGEVPEQTPVLLLSTAPGLAPLAYGVTGAKILRQASWIGAILHIVGGAVGLGIMLTLVLLGALQLITPMNMFLFQLIWLVPALLITEWTRSI